MYCVHYSEHRIAIWVLKLAHPGEDVVLGAWSTNEEHLLCWNQISQIFVEIIHKWCVIHKDSISHAHNAGIPRSSPNAVNTSILICQTIPFDILLVALLQKVLDLSVT